MLLLAKNLKEQTETANKIIKRDTEVVQTSSKLTEKNFGSLKKESDKLQEHSKRAWKCWMWLMMGLVMAIFICEIELSSIVPFSEFQCKISPFSYGDVYEIIFQDEGLAAGAIIVEGGRSRLLSIDKINLFKKFA